MLHTFVDFLIPFDSDNNINYYELKKLINFHIENETKGLCLLSEYSEANSLTDDEKINYINRVIEYADKKIKIIVCVNENTVEKINIFKELTDNLDFDYYLINFEIKTNKLGLIKYYNYISEVLKKPVIIKDNSILDLESIRNLSYNPNIIGILLFDNDINKWIDISLIQKENFHIYCGNDKFLIICESLKINKSISLISNVFPNFYKDVSNENKLENNRKIMKIIDDINLDFNTLSIKYLMYLKGYNMKNTRFPNGECLKEVKRKIEEDCINL